MGEIEYEKKNSMCIIRSCVASVVVLRTTRSNETLTEPNYVLQEYETTKSENGYSMLMILWSMMNRVLLDCMYITIC